VRGALKQNTRMDMEWDGGMLRLCFNPDNPYMFVYLDPEKRYFIQKMEYLDSHNRVRRRTTFTARSMGDGIWVQSSMTRQHIDYTDDGEANVQAELTYTVDEVKVNAPNFVEDVLWIDAEQDRAIRSPLFKAK
jgi:hypothetical protein